MQRQIAFFMQSAPSMVPSRTARMAALCFLSIMATLIAFVGSGPGLIHAAAETDGSGSFATPALEAPDIEIVWSANMTVGRASDSTQSYTGYLPDLSPSEGDLDVTEFTDNDVQYTILGIFQQEFGESVKQLVFSADVPLDDGLYFKAGDDVFPLLRAADLGSGRNIHAWRLKETLGWSEGDVIPLSLFKLVGQVTPVKPLDGDHPEASMLAVYSMTGELTQSGQFDTILVTLETGKRYVVEMKGSATGDGTLSDPWISGINGRFTVGGESRWEPAWYDASGRRSTSVQFPGGQEYHVDENGRMFAPSTGSDGSTVLQPVTGGNDDAGEGFNARLFLVNFPGGEYQVVVSGAPNPNDTGTYTFTLLEIMSDDYSASPDEAGELMVGGSAVGNIESPGDVDWFAVDLEEGVRYGVRIQGVISGAGTLAAPRFTGIYDSQGTLLDDTSNDHENSGILIDRRMTFTPASSATYHVGVSGHDIYDPHRSTPPVGTYTVSVEIQE